MLKKHGGNSIAHTRSLHLQVIDLSFCFLFEALDDGSQFSGILNIETKHWIIMSVTREEKGDKWQKFLQLKAV